MYKSKKLGVIAAASTALILGGCTDSSTQEASISILVPGYDSGYLQEELDNGIADFEEEKGVEVEIISVGWDELNSRIIQLAQANQSPDILLVGTRSLRQFAEEDIIRSLDEYITPEFEEPRVTSVYETAKISDKQYGIPMAFSSRALIYRSDLIDEAPSNWEELLASAEEVSRNHDMNGFYLPIDGAGTSIELMNFFYQNNAFPVDEDGNYQVNSPEIKETAEYLKEFVEKNLVPNPLESPRDDQVQMFVNGDLAMFVTGPWDQEVLDEHSETYPYDVAVLPEGVQPSVNLATDSYVITNGAQNPDGAWEFIEFMSQEEYQRSVSEAFNWFPILEAEISDERFQTEFIQPFLEIIPYGYPDPHTSNWDEFQRAFVLALQESLTGAKSVDDAFDDVQESLQN